MSKILPRFVSASRNSLSQLTFVTLLASYGLAHGQTLPTAGSSTATPPSLVPYTVKALAGGGTAAIALGATCPVSGFTSTDAYGDGCLATEIQLVGPRYATVDSAGNVFFSDYTNGLIRRIDVNTGIVTAVAGGATASPATGATCGTLVSIDARGDGCQATAVHLSHPVGLTFSNPVSLGNSQPSGDLYFGDTGYSNVRKISATGGLIPATNTGVISLVAGSTTSTFGYTANNATGNIIASTSSFLDAPFDVAFDAAGNLYISEEFKSAILVVNTNTIPTTVAGVSIPPGTIAKIAGALAGGVSTCPNSPATTTGCGFGLSTFGGSANVSELRNNYGLAVDTTGDVYFTGEYYNFIGKVSSGGVLTQYAGTQNVPGSKLLRGTPNFGIGSPFGIAADMVGNVYFTDAFNGVIWRVDTGGTTQYVVGGGGTPCSTVVDTSGDGCPALQATFGSSNSSGFASTSNPGIFGVNVDASYNLYVGDTVTNLIREVSSGTQFGNVGETSTVTQTVDVHFVAGDMPGASTPFAITKGSANFSIGTPKCTINSDATSDCLLPLTVAPSALGAFGGTLQVTSALSSASFPLTAVGIMTPITRTSIALTSSGNCTGTTTFSTNTALTFTATLASSGNPTGTVTFFANGVQIGTPQAVAGNAATLTYTFATAGAYSVTATYNGDTYYNKSTSAAAVSVSSAAPSFTAAATPYQYPTVVAGETALYSFTVSQTVYAGTISLSCSALPANSSCSFSPATIVANGCSATNTVALSILTQHGPVTTSSFGGTGPGLWSLGSMVAGFGLALAIGIARRRTPYRFAQLGMVVALLLAASGMMACSDPITTGSTPRTPASPAGQPYTVTVSATGSTGVTSTFTVQLGVQ